MARMKFLCDVERCIECNGCVTACKNEHEVPWGVNRRRVVTLDDGVPGERSISVACMHCSDAPCMAVCPVNCFYRTDEGVVLHDKDLCIGCGYCFYACPFGAPQFPQAGAFGPLRRGVVVGGDYCNPLAARARRGHRTNGRPHTHTSGCRPPLRSAGSGRRTAVMRLAASTCTTAGRKSASSAVSSWA